jgi:uncharacterized membrane protein
MEATAPWHPIVVHFAVALVLAGVAFRVLSLVPRLAGLNVAAVALLLAGTLAVVLATVSGDAAHSPVERVPGSAAAVEDHEEWGERTRNVFLAVAVAEILALLLARRGWARPLSFASAGLCLVGSFLLYEAAEHGGELVYSYAGGVGIRTGDPADVRRLTLAAAYHQAELDRKEGRPHDAASIIAEAAKRFPADPGVQVMAAESLLRDSHDPRAALAVLGPVAVPPGDARLRGRHGMLLAELQEATGDVEAARETLRNLAQAFPGNARIRQKLDALPPPPSDVPGKEP